MATKAQIQSLITEYLDSGSVAGILAINHRTVLKDDANSFLEAIYASGVDDDEVTQTYTTSNARFDYNITFRKIGSEIILTGDFTVNTSAGANVTLFSIDNTDFHCIAKNYVCSTSTSSGGSGFLRIINNVVFTRTAFFAGENHNFTLTYTALN